AGELVDDHHFAVADDVLTIAKELALDLHRTLYVLVNAEHADGMHRVRLGEHADQSAAFGRKLNALPLVVVIVVRVLFKLVGHLGGPLVALDRDELGFARQRADDQRRAGFVDQNAIGLVDQDEERSPLYRTLSARVGGDAEHVAEKISLAFADAAEQQAVAKE